MILFKNPKGQKQLMKWILTRMIGVTNAFAHQWLSCVNRLVAKANQKQVFGNMLLAGIGVATLFQSDAYRHCLVDRLLRLHGFCLDSVTAMFGGPLR